MAIKGVGDFFAVDIGTTAVRVVQLSQSGNGWTLSNYGYAPIDAKTAASSSQESKKKLGDVIQRTAGFGAVLASYQQGFGAELEDVIRGFLQGAGAEKDACGKMEHGCLPHCK